jgi:hypothetical protein
VRGGGGPGAGGVDLGAHWGGHRRAPVVAGPPRPAWPLPRRR